MTNTNAVLVYKTALFRALWHAEVAEKFSERLRSRCTLQHEQIERMANCISVVREILENSCGETHERKKRPAPAGRSGAI